jgi:glycosyltransferase involved in cell wall biosynthesis
LVNKNTPRVSIGLPVFNAENIISNAIESILNQSFVDFELIISDNNSTDRTMEICKKYEDQDNRVKFYKQTENIGPERNFQFVLEKAKGEYFKWCAGDDVMSLDFIEMNYNFLENHKDYVLSSSPARFENGKFDKIKLGDHSIDNQYVPDRIISFFSSWHANSRFYGLTKRIELLRVSFDCFDKVFLGNDWCVIIKLLMVGKSKRLNKGEVILGISGISNNNRAIARYRKSIWNIFIPFFQLTKLLLKISKKWTLIEKKEIWKKLFLLNAKAIEIQFKLDLIRLFPKFYKVYKKNKYK